MLLYSPSQMTADFDELQFHIIYVLNNLICQLTREVFLNNNNPPLGYSTVTASSSSSSSSTKQGSFRFSFATLGISLISPSKVMHHFRFHTATS
ncbi:unnamed protein product [Citrullus colocynthis]|uniref:Uncharacterized protein n=1 Tax=Citrullus colocynthis TaxID=252529 RepID=A0ABP0Y3Q8_9ROSI